jgi:hypothetical protein
MPKTPKPYSRRRLNELRKAWLWERRSRVAASIAVLLGVMAMVTALAALAGDHPSTWYALGAIHVAIVGIVAHGWNSAFLLNHQEAIGQLRGAWGEENTRSELEIAKRRRLIWGWVDTIKLEGGDIDHVVVTRRGGVVVIDSKWRNQTDDRGALDMAAAAHKVRVRAEAVTRSLVTPERARHRARGNAIRIRPVVVLWGALQGALPSGEFTKDGIEFVAGRHLRSWLRKLDGDAVTKESAGELVSLLERFRTTSALADQSRQLARRKSSRARAIGG